MNRVRQRRHPVLSVIHATIVSGFVHRRAEPQGIILILVNKSCTHDVRHDVGASLPARPGSSEHTDGLGNIKGLWFIDVYCWCIYMHVPYIRSSCIHTASLTKSWITPFCQPIDSQIRQSRLTYILPIVHAYFFPNHHFLHCLGTCQLISSFLFVYSSNLRLRVGEKRFLRIHRVLEIINGGRGFLLVGVSLRASPGIRGIT